VTNETRLTNIYVDKKKGGKPWRKKN
jgi:hypothetical protein